MKVRFCFILLFTLYSSVSLGQSLSSKNLQYLLVNQLEGIDLFLSKKGLTFVESQDLDNCKLISWGNSEICLVSRSFCKDPITNFVIYSFYNKDEFDKLKKNILKSDFKLDVSKIDEKKHLVSTYSNSSFYIKFVSNGEVGNNIFTISFGYKNNLLD
jgi:hypothetical protein